MPTDIVDVSYDTAAASPTRETYNDVIIVTTASVAPSPGYNTPSRYSDPATVADDFGDGSGAHESSEVLDVMGVESWYVVALEATDTTEVLGNSDEASESEGTVDNAPMMGDVTVAVDGTDAETTAVAVSPPDANGAPAAGEAYYNGDTGEVATGDASSGAGAGISVTYSYASWDDAKVAMASAAPDVAFLANTHVDASNIGNLNELVTWGVANDCAVLAAGPDGRDYDSDTEAMQAYHDLASYVPSGNTALFAHKSSDDVAAYFAGQCGVEEAAHDVMYYSGGYPGLTSDSYRSSLVGEPGVANTFEGGDADETGPVNVLINVQGQLVASNSLTTAGAGSNYRYLDVWRTERFAVTEAKNALIGLSLRVDSIPFSQDGRALIVGALNDQLADHVGSRQPFLDLEIDVPTRDALSDENIANRIWGPITISGTLTGNAHTFEVRFAASV